MFFRIPLFIILITAFLSVEALGQLSRSNAADASKATSRERNDEDDSPASRGMLENKERWRMAAEEKEHRELLERSDRVAQLTDQLNKSFGQNSAFANGDATKLAELEKLVKKIRKNLGAGDDDDTMDETKPATLAQAFIQLSEMGATLNEELKKQTRHEISADSIAKSNEMLDLINLIRNFAHLK